MKFLALLLAVFTSVTVKAQSLDRYDSDFRSSRRTTAQITAYGELVIGGVAFASTFNRKIRSLNTYKLNTKVTVALWKKYLPNESAKITEAMNERDKTLKELAALKKSPTAATAETQKLIKETQAYAREWELETRRLIKELQVAREAKLGSYRFVGGVLPKTFKVVRWVGKAVTIYAVVDGASRLIGIYTDDPSKDVSSYDLENITAEQLQEMVPSN